MESKIVEALVLQGNLASLSVQQKTSYYLALCQSLGLNPVTQPFGIYSLNGKEVMYARKGATDQLRKIHGISITDLQQEIVDGLLIFTVTATDKTGRSDTDVGVVAINNLQAEARANAIMKCLTKAKRRVTLSLCGLGMLDETEITEIGATTVELPVIDAEKPIYSKWKKPEEAINWAYQLLGDRNSRHEIEVLFDELEVPEGVKKAPIWYEFVLEKVEGNRRVIC